MRILREGQRELVMQSRRFECDTCKCIFIADNNEYRHSNDQREGSTWWCDCPCCGKPVITNEAPLACDLEIVPISTKKR
uniref:Transcriptional repressor n=1 Tax=Siphoviridae sp. ctgBD49 TaxID=2826420 RepID=A0A8S5QQ56_9CAUD|nr:MAG TPA: transcriptional repressor [Siphoviridae sp. ctgBD49]